MGELDKLYDQMCQGEIVFYVKMEDIRCDNTTDTTMRTVPPCEDLYPQSPIFALCIYTLRRLIPPHITKLRIIKPNSPDVTRVQRHRESCVESKCSPMRGERLQASVVPY